jgi:predicted RND superfamily exporter protein
MRSYGEWIIAHRVAVIIGALLVTALWFTRIGAIKLDSDPKLWTPHTHPYVLTTELLEEVFGGRNITVIGIYPKQGDIYQPQVLAKIKRIQDGLELLPNAIRHNILSFAARKAKAIHGGSEGMEVRQMMDAVPQTPEEIARLKAAVASMPIYVNALVSPDGKAAAIIGDFKTLENDPSFVGLMAGMRKVVDRERDGTVDIHLGGTPIIGEAADLEFMKLPLYFGGALLIIMAIQFFSFRSFQGMFLPTVTGLLSVIWALGIMGFLGVHIDPLNSNTPVLILAVAAGHAIQILKRYHEEYQRLSAEGLSRRDANRQAVVESIVRVGPVMLAAGSIASITFFTLAGTGVPMVQHFGVFAGGGVLSVMILEMTIMPALRSLLLPPKKLATKSQDKPGILDRFLLGIANALIGGRARTIVIAGLVLLAVAGLGISRLVVDNNFRLYHKPSTTLRIDDKILNATFGGTNSMQFLVETPNKDGIKDPQVLKAMANLQSFLESQPNVGKTQSIGDLLKRMNQAMHADQQQFYSIPDSRALVAQYLFLYSLSGDPQDFDSLVDNDYRRATIWAYIKDDSTTYAGSVAEKAKAVIAKTFPPGVTVRVGGDLAQVVALNEVIVRDKTKNIVQMAVVVFVLGSILFRSLVGGLFSVIPLIAVVVANFGLMGWLGTKVDITAMTSAAMAIGIGADYEIYLLFRFREELARTGNVAAATRACLLTSGKAVIFVAISVIGGYAILQTSGFAFFNQLSNMVTSTMIMSVFFALFFLRALMMIFKPRFIFGDQREALFAQPAVASPGEGR